VVAGILVALVWAASGLARFYLDLLWFREVGKTQVFWGVLGAEVGLGLLTGLGTAAVLGGNLWVAQRIATPDRLMLTAGPQTERLRVLLLPHLRSLRLGVVAMLGLLVGLYEAGHWRTLVLWRNQVPFGDRDAQFGRDIGYYVFSLPLQRAILGWLLFTLLAATLLVIGEHLLAGGIQPAARGNRVAPHVHAHLAILLGCIVLLKAWGYRLDQFSLVFSPRGVVTGASYTDVHAQLPALRLLVLVAPVCAVLFFLNVRSRDFTLPVAGMLLLGLSSLLVGGVYPWFVQRFQVTPQELQREERYIQRNINATRRAFALEGVQTKEFAAAEDLTPAEVRANAATVDNIRLWEADVLQTAIQNLQAIGQYYEFSDVDVDRYRIGGAVRQVMISAREVDPRNLDASAQTWVNLYLAYTHGYGVVAAQVNRAETSGRPDFVVRGFNQEQAAIPVRQPRIYFGEPPPDTPAYVVVGSRQPEVGSPSVSGQSQASFRYDGRGGVQLSGPLRRLVAALHFRDLNLLISSNLNGRSRILFNRDIRDRMEKAARSCSGTPIRMWPWSTAVSCSSATATPPLTTTRTRSGSCWTSPRGGPTLTTGASTGRPTTSATRSRRWSTPTTAPPPCTPSTRPTRCCGPGAARSRACSRRAPRCPPTCRRTCATRRTCSPSRPTATPPTTSARPATSTPSRTSGPCPRTARASSPTARARWPWPAAESLGCGPTTCSPGCRGSRTSSSSW